MRHSRKCWYCGTHWMEQWNVDGEPDSLHCPDCGEQWLDPEDDPGAAIHDDCRTEQYFDPNTSDKEVWMIPVETEDA